MMDVYSARQEATPRVSGLHEVRVCPVASRDHTTIHMRVGDT